MSKLECLQDHRWPQDYPQWDPPGYVLSQDHGAWTRSVAKRHYQWYINSIPNRVLVIEEFLSLRINSESSFQSSVSCVFGFITQDAEPFVSKFDHPDRVNQGSIPSGKGNALLADLGLALAVCLQNLLPNPPCWRLSKTTGRKLYANMPVLVPTIDAPIFNEVNPARLCMACGWEALKKGSPDPLSSLWGVLYSKFTR